ncbi:MAG: hypothetical protein IPO09_16900 [Anaeromyxobacter sp.]|nr:hypothetical protein [Anaeromyxobacter sp.]MBL0276617.1 hypothetical protein [Anaeromyxobacter sp.]
MALTRPRPLGVLAALLLLASLPACDPPGPNGMHQVLFFRQEPWTPDVGAPFRLDIPDRVHVGDYWEGKGLIYIRGKTYTYDFAGTTLEVTPPPSIAVVSTTLEDGGWRLSLRCDAEPGGELQVRVLAAGAERYADATFINCYPAAP